MGTTTQVNQSSIDAGAAAVGDLLLMLGVDPDERPEHGGDSVAETVARAVLATCVTVEADAPSLPLYDAYASGRARALAEGDEANAHWRGLVSVEAMVRGR